MNEHDVIITNKKVNDSIEKGTIGVILYIFDTHYLVEFFDKNGNTIGNGMETVSKEDINPYKFY